MYRVVYRVMYRACLIGLVLPATLCAQGQPQLSRPEPALSAPTATVAVAEPSGANPQGFRSLVQGTKVLLRWQPVPNVSWYLVNGPELGVNGQEVQDTMYVVGPLAPGAYEWTVGSLSGQGQAPLTSWKQWPKVRAVVEQARLPGQIDEKPGH
jgi:hypothetical protein